jgi:peptide/nickel transport system permease protein
MRQRVMIAVALSCEPKLIIADEPTTALDVTIQAQILELMKNLTQRLGVALIIITHNLGVVAEIADRVIVMYAAQVVEQGRVAAVFGAPLHPYTSALLAAVPDDDADPAAIGGAVPLPHAFPDGCRFAPRCVHARPACEAAPPALDDAGDGRQVRCLRWDELRRAGAAE